ncbi:MAG: hypothetical protein WCL28_13050, partial [bacterium]
MTKSLNRDFQRGSEAVHALERLLLAADSLGIRLVAGLALELLLKKGIMGRSLHSRTQLPVSFAVSVTVLSDDMEKVLVRKQRRGKILPRQVIDDDDMVRFSHLASQLAAQTSGNQSTEIALGGRALSVELWDDMAEQVIIGFNFLAIARGLNSMAADSSWEFLPFSQLNIDGLDPRETLALSEMLTIMGIDNPYEISSEDV